MKTILYLIPHLEQSSPVTQLFGMIKYLDPMKYKPVVLSFFKERPNSSQHMFEACGIKVINGNLERWQLFKQNELLKQTIKDENADIIHSCSILTDGICSSLKLNIPVVITLHCFIYEDVITRYGKIVGRFLCSREERTIRKATTAVTVSRTLAEKYRKRINRDFVPIQNGIETSLWIQEEGITKEDLRKKLKLPNDEYIVLSTNLLDSIKDPLLLIQAFKDAKIPDSLLIMLGNGNMQEECLKNGDKNILFTGKVKNVKDYLYASDVLVSASKSEGMPYAILEAKCTGIRMILSDIPQHKEVMEDSLDVDYFCCGNKSELERLIKANYSKRERNTYDLNHISAENMSKAYQSIYSSF